MKVEEISAGDVSGSASSSPPSASSIPPAHQDDIPDPSSPNILKFIDSPRDLDNMLQHPLLKP